MAKNIVPYVKHQLYKGRYEMTEGGVIRLPDKCHFIVRRYIGGCHFISNTEERGRIALILAEGYGNGMGFWSMISFLTDEEAKKLAGELLSSISPQPARAKKGENNGN